MTTGSERAGGGPPIALAVISVAALAAMLVAIVVTVASPQGLGETRATAAPTVGTSGNAARQTAGLAIRTLGAQGIQVVEPRTPYRPAESPTLFSTPRLVLQAVLPDDPTGGQFLIYEFPTSGGATDAGREYASYIASGVGRVQFPNDARFVLQQVGTTLVFFTWSPESTTDERTDDVATALASLGAAIPVAP